MCQAIMEMREEERMIGRSEGQEKTAKRMLIKASGSVERHSCFYVADSNVNVQ